MAESEREQPGAAGSTTGRTRAQAEFEAYRARAGAPGSTGGPFPGSGGAVPAWGFPPSMVMLPRMPGPAYPGGLGDGSIRGRLGATLGLGLDLVNAGLTEGLRLLGGLSSMMYGLGSAAPYGGHGHEGCGCEACCEPCGCDCCGVTGSDPCCRPSVGTCC